MSHPAMLCRACMIMWVTDEGFCKRFPTSAEQECLLRACTGISARLALQVLEQSSRRLPSHELWDTLLAEPASMDPVLFKEPE